MAIKSTIKSILFILLIIFTSKVSASTTIDFDKFPDGSAVPSITLITDQYASVGAVFSGAFARSIIATETVYSDWLQANYPGTFSPDNVISVRAGQAEMPTINNLSPNGVAVTFKNPVTGAPATTDMVSATFMDTEIGSTLGTITAFDISGAIIGEVTKYTTETTFDIITISVPGIASVYMTTDSDGADIDNFTFNGINVIPAPGAAILGMIGVGLTGWIRRKQMF